MIKSDQGGYIIWSTEHHAWWASNKSGYVIERSKAGVYSFQVACDIIEDANKFCDDADEPKECMIRIF